ncbi:MAG: hypothetical protein ACUVTL_10660 [Thermoproteota archaeon]
MKLIPCNNNCKLELVASEEVQKHALKIYYLLTVLTTKRWQKILEVAIDDSGQEAPWLYKIRGLISDEEPKKFQKEFIQFLLDRAAQILKDKVDQELNELRVESERLLSESINRIQNYYTQLRDETINQAEYTRSQLQSEFVRGKRSILSSISFEEAERLISEYDKLEASDIEKEKARYRIMVKATIAAALLLSYSSFRCRLLLRSLNGSIGKEIFLNLLPNGEVEDPILWRFL